MSPKTVHDVAAALAIVALVGTVSMVVARVVPSVVTLRYLDLLHKVQLQLAALVAVAATLGSLWFSEYGNHWAPCRFCWYQRVFMYSSAVVLLVAAVRRDRGVRWYAVPLAAIGLLVSLWHNLLERGVVQESNVCSTTVRCAIPYEVSFGYRNGNSQPAGFPSITLAVMAFCAFAAILALLLTPQALPSLDNVEDDQHGESATR